MANYQLDVAFTNEQLETLFATGSNVIIGKKSVAGLPNVAWQVFRPFQNNVISWEDEYGIYVSPVEIKNGEKLFQASTVNIGAVTGQLYTLEPSAVISGPISSGQQGAYALLNKYSYKSYMTVGLFQNAVVNFTDGGKNCISANSVLLNSTAIMEPFTTVYIWIQANLVSNSIVTTITSVVTELKFDNSVTTLSVKYESSTGKFINASSNALDDDRISYIAPSL